MATLLKSFETGGDSDSPIGDLGGDEYNLAQSFSLDSTATVNRVDLYLKKSGTISDSITVTIETDAAGPKPSGTLVNASATQVITPTNATYDWISVVFPAGFSLTGSTKYWVKCTVPGSQATGNRYDWYRNSAGGLYIGFGQSVSTNGSAYSNEDALADCYFRVYEEDATTTSTTTSTTSTSTSSSTTTTSTSTSSSTSSSTTTTSTSTSTTTTSTSTSTTTTSTSTTTTSTSTTTTSTSTSTTSSTSTTTSDSTSFSIESVDNEKTLVVEPLVDNNGFRVENPVIQ